MANYPPLPSPSHYLLDKPYTCKRVEHSGQLSPNHYLLYKVYKGAQYSGQLPRPPPCPPTVHIYDSESTQCDPGHPGEFPSHQLHNVINLMVAQIKIFLWEGGEEEKEGVFTSDKILTHTNTHLECSVHNCIADVSSPVDGACCDDDLTGPLYHPLCPRDLCVPCHCPYHDILQALNHPLLYLQ